MWCEGFLRPCGAQGRPSALCSGSQLAEVTGLDGVSGDGTLVGHVPDKCPACCLPLLRLWFLKNRVMPKVSEHLIYTSVFVF